MIEPSQIVDQLREHCAVFDSLLRHVPGEQVRWKPAPDKWCLLEVVCHLRDVETGGGRVRLKHTLDTPEQPLPPMDPGAWLIDRRYMEQDFLTVMSQLMTERNATVKWLNSLRSPNWESIHHHPEYGPMSARMFLHNMLAHDYFHFRQIVRLKYAYLKETGGQPLDYAGPWGE
jgi:hypothetical protein